MRVQHGRSSRPLQLVLLVQGLYYFLGGLWPLVWLESFLWVVGPKGDIFLLRTVSVLFAVIGLALLLEAARRRPASSVVMLGIVAALSVAAIDIWHISGLRWVYWLDVALESVLAIALMVTWARSDR